jgi:hypothetical protein
VGSDHPRTTRALASATAIRNSLCIGNWQAPDELVEKAMIAVDDGWARGTRRNHEGATARFRAFCSETNVPDELMFPVAEPVLCAWLASMYGCKSGSTARNELAGLRAEHIRRNIPFPSSERVIKILEGIERSRPESSKLPPRAPVTLEMVRILVDFARGTRSSFVLAVVACALVAFWGQFRLGELLPASRNAFNARLFPTRAAWGSHRRPTISLPWTKTTKTRGAVIRLPPQTSRTCPVAAMDLYIRQVHASAASPLFSYDDGKGSMVPLSKRAFILEVNRIWAHHGFARITGHAFRIGGTSELLRQGVDPDIVKVSGRWSSDSFLRYWRSNDEILPQHLDNIIISSRPARAAPRG